MSFYPFWLFNKGMTITAPTITLPDTMYALEGREFVIYFDNVIRAQFPLDCYDIDVSTTATSYKSYRQFHLANRWSFTPTSADAGSNNITISIYFNNTLLTSKTCTIVTKALTSGTGATRQFIMIGDSITAAGRYHAELVRFGLTDPMTITQLGTNTHSDKADSTYVTRTVSHNGHAGNAIADYYSNFTFPFHFDGSTGTVQNPFIENSGELFNFAYYLSHEGYSLNSGDWVTIELGGNDAYQGMETEALMVAKLATMKTQLDYMIANIQANSPSGIRIALFLPLQPSSSQDAAGRSYFSGKRRKDFSYCIKRVAEMYYTNYSSLFPLIPYNACLDTVNNTQVDPTAVLNSRNLTTYSQQSNCIHPGLPGYWQFADCLYSFLKGNET